VRQQDRLLTIDEVAQQLSVSKDWVYRNGKKLTFSKKLAYLPRNQKAFRARICWKSYSRLSELEVISGTESMPDLCPNRMHSLQMCSP